ncbi:hypothetical protein Skr01_02300 [Sphaerisporangium krabiense]|nr:hypothetical protein Skr01_02300 [Sphaerisporangium krabiense]
MTVRRQMVVRITSSFRPALSVGVCETPGKADSRDDGGFGGRERALDPNAGPGAFFGSELRRCRKKAGLSQPQLRMVGVF